MRNLAGVDIKELTGWPNCGEGTAGKMAAFFLLASRLYGRRAADATASPEALELVSAKLESLQDTQDPEG